MRVVFFGTPEFAVPSLTALRTADVDVATVVTQPDRPRTRSHSTLQPSPVKVCALAAGIPVLQPERPRDEPFYAQLRALRPDLGVVVAYGHLLRTELLGIPRLGFVNIHASLLPRWRGAAPIQWALLSGDATTGVSIMRVEAGLDTGAVWHARDLAIDDGDTAATLTTRLSELGAEALIEVLPRIAAGEAPTPQTEAGASHAPKISRDLARIRWNDAPAAVSCRIRAMDPSPGAWTTIAGADVKIFGAPAMAWGPGAAPLPPEGRPSPAVPARAAGALPAGTILSVNGTVMVTTGDHGAVEIVEVQPAGRRRMLAAEWTRGAVLSPGARFE